VPAGAANELDLPKETVRLAGTVKDVLEIGVAAGTAAGETSPIALAPAFDIHYPSPPALNNFSVSGTSTLSTSWYVWKYTDPNPGDPLDRDAPTVFHPTYQVGSATPVPLGPATTATTMTLTGPKPPYDFYLWSENEWARGYDTERLHARQTAFTASVPSWMLAGTDTVISGTYNGPVNARLTLQARNSASTPWYAVVSGDFTGSKYRFAIPSRGTRQYRVVLANRSDSDATAWYGGYSAAATSTVQQRVTTTGTQTVWRSGAGGETCVYVNPPIEGLAALQRWNGKVWVFVQNVNVRYGWGCTPVNKTVLGRTTYRYYVPNHLYGGNLVASAYSPNFVITVTP
jgi:hypothetical protein